MFRESMLTISQISASIFSSAKHILIKKNEERYLVRQNLIAHRITFFFPAPNITFKLKTPSSCLSLTIVKGNLAGFRSHLAGQAKPSEITVFVWESDGKELFPKLNFTKFVNSYVKILGGGRILFTKFDR